MSDENQTIHDFDLNIICDYFSHFERQGPGSPEMTLKALSFIDKLTEDSRIADLGCGTGGQTMVLAQHVPGHITGVDIFQKFIDLFNKNAREHGLQGRVKGLVGSMDDLKFKEKELDLIWAEGSIYNIGFERGLKEWRKYLKDGGFVAVTEASWFTEERPDEIVKFWHDAYPGIDTIYNQLGKLQKAGYLPIAAFMLPENCWTEHFFAPQPPVHKSFLEEKAGNKAAEGLVNNMIHEAKMYEKYGAYYGYTFFIGKKI